MLISFDVGNTLTNVGLSSDDEIIDVFSLETVKSRSKDELGSSISLLLRERGHEVSKITRAIISSVVPNLTGKLSQTIAELFKIEPLVVGPGLKSGIRLAVENPKEVGSDLVVGSVGAYEMVKKAAFVADLGTASKFYVVGEKGEFLGVSIAPGLTISLASLVEKASSLFTQSLAVPQKELGRNTIDAMNSGALYGLMHMIEGFLDHFERELGLSLCPIITGGNASYLLSGQKGPIVSFPKPFERTFLYEPHLVIKGLMEIDRRCRQ